MKGNLQEPGFVYFSFTAFSRQGKMELVKVYGSCFFDDSGGAGEMLDPTSVK